jgi:hypothetical protein
MYDPVTAELIRRIPPIEGVDVPSLPELLAETQVQISTLRVRLGDGAFDYGEIYELMSRLRLLATPLSLHACLASDGEDRSAAAFVAASAHRMLFSARPIVGLDRALRHTVSASVVSSDLAAALLFLAAGYPADAAEVAGDYRPPVAEPRAPLVAAIVALARGDLVQISGLRVDVADTDDDSNRQSLSYG